MENRRKCVGSTPRSSTRRPSPPRHMQALRRLSCRVDPVLGMGFTLSVLDRHGVRAVPWLSCCRAGAGTTPARYLRLTRRTVDDRPASAAVAASMMFSVAPTSETAACLSCAAYQRCSLSPAVLLYLRAHLPQRREVDVHRPLLPSWQPPGRLCQPRRSARQQRPP